MKAAPGRRCTALKLPSTDPTAAVQSLRTDVGACAVTAIYVLRRAVPAVVTYLVFGTVLLQ